MTSIDKTGTSVEDLISAFRREYQIKDWELKYDVIKKPSAGFFGIGARKTAVVRFHLPSLGERAANLLSNLLSKMGISHDKVDVKNEGKSIYLEIKGSQDSGFLIGKNGNMLETLQFFVNRIYEHDRSLERIYIDVEGYRERREATFLRQFLPLIKKVRELNKAQTLEPMNASDRRIIHRHVERDRHLRTLTIGEGEKKRIVIFPAKQSEAEVLGQAKQARPQAAPQNGTQAAPAKRPPRPQNQPPRPRNQQRRPAPRKQEAAKDE